MTPSPESIDPTRIALERDFFRRILELGGRDDIRPFLEEALALITEMTGASCGYLELDGGRFSRASGFSERELDAVRLDISSGIIARALSTGRTISTASALDDPRFGDLPSVRGSGIRAVLCAPVGRDPPLGVLYLQGRPEPGPFPDEDRENAELFTRHLAPLADRLIAREDAELERDYTDDLRRRLHVQAIVGKSRALASVFQQVLMAAPVRVPLLVTGESGTGKTAIARAVHDSSPRAGGPFMELAAAAIPDALIESELFGAEKGAHSTADRRIVGKVEAAHGGTLFLDEIGELSLDAQKKLLTFLQSRKYFRLGNPAAFEADVRIIAATNKILPELVQAGRFREDLYYRLNVLEIRMPRLSERREDIPAVSDAIVERLNTEHGRVLTLSRGARSILADLAWPGNVRELENALTKAWAKIAAEGGAVIDAQHVMPANAAAVVSKDVVGFQEATRRFQARLVADTLQSTRWNVSKAAVVLGMSRSHLNDLIKAFGLRRQS